jgi:hypothetical protein
LEVPVLKPAVLFASLLMLLPAAVLAAPSQGPDLGGVEDAGRHEARTKKKDKTRKKPGRQTKEEDETPPPPPPDGDADGVPDADDKCPEEAEDKDLFEDKDGCPDPDNDGDGVLDVDDDCPAKPENMDGIDDDDGCPEPPPKIAPLNAEMTLMDGTVITGRVVRIIAFDEDEKDAKPEEIDALDVILSDDSEWPTDWSNVRGLKSEKVRFTEAVDCYSEGVQELGEETVWECTLKHPTIVTLAETDHRGNAHFLDRKMKRLDFKFAPDGFSCTGNCDVISENNTVALYLYKLIAVEQNDDEAAAVTSLQVRLREMQKVQIKTAKLKPAPVEEPKPEPKPE